MHQLLLYKHYFITGSDRIELSEKLKKLDPKKTVFIVSSKSFTTDETIESLKDAIHWSGDMNKFIAITANKKEAQKFNFKHILNLIEKLVGDIQYGLEYLLLLLFLLCQPIMKILLIIFV